MFQYRLVSVEYFLDRMLPNEVLWLLDGIGYANRDEWEMVRTLLRPHMKKGADAKKCMPLPWDGEVPAEMPPKDIDKNTVSTIAEMLEARIEKECQHETLK